MITEKNKVFMLTTRETSYIFRVLPSGHLENLHYGDRLREQDFRAIHMKQNAGAGSSVLYMEGAMSLDLLPLEYAPNGKGDYRIMPMEMEMPDGSFVTDFVYAGHEIIEETLPMETLPTAHGEDAVTLIVTLRDKLFPVTLKLIYTVFYDADVITRRVLLKNGTDQTLKVRKIMSASLDLLSESFDVITLDGGWIREAHAHRRNHAYGTLVNESSTGSSSNRHNPGVILARPDTTEDHGRCYGMNLLYSGNHQTAVEVSSHGIVRVMTGISPHNFLWPLAPGAVFEAPEAVLTTSGKGLNDLSHHFHDFVNHHVISRRWSGKERPVLLNNWEATFFDFNERKILSMAREAKKLGVELFVLDDGWFGDRNDDTAGLGDYEVNRKKLPGGIRGLADKINAMGLYFGLWFEPEMVNEDSALFRKHPEYAIRVPGRKPSKGRNQLVLDLAREEVQSYIISQVEKVLASAPIAYVKWDMNRHISDLFSEAVPHQGMAYHSYILGLYRVLRKITEDFPDVLFESCSSGGNRFDLGMLCYMPQTWASDNTDPIERLKIQGGLSYFYPPSTMGAHVSQSPHQQTLRRTPLETRFHAASFGLLGYELDLQHLNLKEKEEITQQISWYKAHRKLMQFGRFYRYDEEKDNRVNFMVVREDQEKAVLGNFQILQKPSPSFDVLRFKGLQKERLYQVETVKASMDIEAFGELLKHITPVKLKPGGLILRNARKIYRLPHNVERYDAYGDLLQSGIRISQQFMGTGYSKETRMLGDFGSQLMTVISKGEEENGDR